MVKTAVEVEIRDQIERWPIEKLLPYARNARTHSDEQVSQIAASMREWGWTNPILVDECGMIIAGHGRVLAAKLLGMPEVPVIVASRWGDEKKRAYVLADNKLAENAGWDDELLRLELLDLQTAGYDLDLIGFGEDELEERLADADADAGLTDPDDAPDLPADPITRPGDIWQLGRHRVMCGDSLAAEAWAALMQGVSADCVWTDPPYNVAYTGAAGSIKNDKMSDAKFREFLTGAMSQLLAVMKPGSAIYVAHADGEPGYAFREAFSKAGFKISGCLIWQKNQFTLSYSDYQWMHEPILYGWRPGATHRWYGGRKQTTIHNLGEQGPISKMDDGRWCIKIGDSVLIVDGEAKLEEHPLATLFHDKPQRSAEHPTMKPVGLIEKMLRSSARPGDIVVDAFGGSGSTLIAAHRLGMNARLMELDEKFVDVIVRRWQEHTGLEAVLEADGRGFAEVEAGR